MNSPDGEKTGIRAGKREWIGLAVLGLPTLLVSVDIGVLFLALPHLSGSLHASGTEQLWITDIYGFMIAGLLVTMGTVGDRIGRRKLLLVGAAAFGVMSLVAAFSTSPEMLVIARALLGVAGATLMPSTLALITNMFRDDKQRGTAIAAWVSCMMVGAALGPVVGGLMLEFFWWGSVFLLGVPVMLLLLAFGPVFLPEHRDPGAGRLDPVSVVLSLVAILPVVYGLKNLAVDRGAPLISGAAILVGVAFGVVFVRRQMALTDPLLDLRLFGNRAFSATLTSMLMGAAAMAGVFLLISQYLQNVLGYSPSTTGLLLVPMGLSIAVSSQFAPVLARRIRHSHAIAGGLVLGSAGFALVAMAGKDDGLLFVLLGGILVHLGTGPLFALGAHLVVGSAPAEKAGSAASLSETSNELGVTIGIALMGTIGAATYRAQMNDSIPSGVPDDQASIAVDTVAGAGVSAGQLPTDQAAELLSAAHQAFTSGLNIAAVVGGAIFVSLAIMMANVLRKRADESKGTEASAAESDEVAAT